MHSLVSLDLTQTYVLMCHTFRKIFPILVIFPSAGLIMSLLSLLLKLPISNPVVIIKMKMTYAVYFYTPRQCIKSRDITLPTKVYLLKAKVFPGVMCGSES